MLCGGWNMGITVYFGKVNLKSEHIYDVYSGKTDIRDILVNTLISFYDGLEIQEEYSYIGNDGEVYSDVIDYHVSLQEKTDTYLYGVIYKKSKLYYKELDELTNELETKSVSNTDGITFYFDVFNEIVGYNTTKRFGHKKFLEVFAKLINKCVDENGYDYEFSVDRYVNGLDISEIKNELNKIRNIHRLTFSFQPANPNNDILKSIQENGKGQLQEFEDANLSTKSVILTSSSKLGLNINASIIQEQINSVDNLQKSISSKTATKNGYVKVEAIGSDGVVHSTADQAPVKKSINRMIEFKPACEEIIKRRMSKSVSENKKE